MPSIHVFVETSFLFSVFRMPSKRQRDALQLKARFDSDEVKLYVPYVCFQEARHLIATNLPSNRCTDLMEFHQFAASMGLDTWNFGEVKKLLEAATSEVKRTKSVYQRDLLLFQRALGDTVLHGTNEVFDLLESLTDVGDLKYNDKLILSSVLTRAKNLKDVGETLMYFASVDKKDLDPGSSSGRARPRMAKYYAEAGLTFLPDFVLPDLPSSDGPPQMSP